MSAAFHRCMGINPYLGELDLFFASLNVLLLKLTSFIECHPVLALKVHVSGHPKTYILCISFPYYEYSQFYIRNITHCYAVCVYGVGGERRDTNLACFYKI